MKREKEKKGFLLLMRWAGKNRYYIYGSVFLALLASVCGIVPYLVFYKLIDAAAYGTLDIGYGVHLAVILIVFTAIRVICNALASLSSHKGAYNTLYTVRCMVTEHMAKMPIPVRLF